MAFGQIRPAAPYSEEMTPDKLRFRALYEELVENQYNALGGKLYGPPRKLSRDISTPPGYPDEDVHIVVAPDEEKKGNLVAVLHGSNPQTRPMLLLAHLDVVEADPKNWERDPFTLFEQNNFFYGRGAADDKSMVAIFADSMIRYREEGFQPQRDIKMALTCGEETSYDFNGIRLSAGKIIATSSRPNLPSTKMAMASLMRMAKRVALLLQAGQKVSQTFELEVINRGGHAARPRPRQCDQRAFNSSGKPCGI